MLRKALAGEIAKQYKIKLKTGDFNKKPDLLDMSMNMDMPLRWRLDMDMALQ